VIEGANAVVNPSESETLAATWDAPDLVWIGGVLPAHQVASGVLLAALMGMVPTLIYVGVLYWVDRYEKEPKRLLTTAFVWGAIPSMLMAAAVELFFNLPPDLIGPQALEAVRLGLVAPILQEALKGIAVLFIAWRYRREFDNVLDGIIYGAMVGFGFAMTGNVISYAGSFLLWGFEGLSPAAFAEGIVYGLDNALYTAAFGASLGLGRLVKKRWQRWALPLVGFTLAVGTHALHNFVARSLVGLSPITIITTMLGLILIMIVGVWSLDRQRRCLTKELRGEIPAAVYRALTTPVGRTRARWRALWKQGIGAWWYVRRLHQLCAELAFKKMQARLWPDEADIVQIIERLRQEIASLVKDLEGKNS
jgi:RsiW-degrading membrane proteinase PrsW (M82 family)